ncbi:MAG: diaminopimelate decarboxylase [Planctomycetes bacterium]|nr:diaminopimelate decarboxylase [Planctomycetota bacterium]
MSAAPAGRPPFVALAAQHGTPLWVTDGDAVRARLRELRGAFAGLLDEVHYSVKANSSLALLRLLAAEGAGFDVVSGGELERCRRIGVDPGRIVFAGVGKSDAELAAGLDLKIGLFDVESSEELDRLGALAAARGVVARFALRLNPDVEAGTHEYVTTGTKRNKFGLPFEEALAALRQTAGNRALDFRGFHVHIGSQIGDPGCFAAAAVIVADHVRAARFAGFAVELLNFGGGFAVAYDSPAPLIAAIAAAVRPLLEPLRVRLLLEPGRWLVAEAGSLLCRVLAVKETPEKTFAIVDAAMNDLLRPALYGAWHPVELLLPAGESRPTATVDVVGPICESGDFLAKERVLPCPRAGDLLLIGVAGAYGTSMSSQYNSRPRAPEVLIDGGRARLVRRRETMDDLLATELEPD